MTSDDVCSPPIMSCLRELPTRTEKDNGWRQIISWHFVWILLNAITGVHLTWSGHVGGGCFCGKRAASPSVVWAQSGHRRGRCWQVTCPWSPWEKEVLVPLPIHRVICEHHNRCQNCQQMEHREFSSQHSSVLTLIGTTQCHWCQAPETRLSQSREEAPAISDL